MNVQGLFEFRDISSAIEKQRLLSQMVISRSPSKFEPRLVCGMDVAYDHDRGVAVAVVWSLPESKAVEMSHVNRIVRVPYLPGLLGFREGPLVTSAVQRLKLKPDVFLVDGHGRAHPRRFGLASHVGLALDLPTIGVAKSPLHGKIVKKKILGLHKRVLGRVLETERGRQYFVSVGHRVGLQDAVKVVKRCLVEDYPAPLRAAHLEASRLRGQMC